jgi:hypothetical protein
MQTIIPTKQTLIWTTNLSYKNYKLVNFKKLSELKLLVKFTSLKISVC